MSSRSSWLHPPRSSDCSQARRPTHLWRASIVSISLNPLVYRSAKPINSWLASRSWAAPLLKGRRAPSAGGLAASPEDGREARYRAVVIGYGPVGRTLARLLHEQGIDPVIVEMNLSTVQKLREGGATAVYGDATLRPTLEQAGVAVPPPSS